MKRLTQKRINGIKTGYWSASKKDELVARLAEYEDTGLEPAEVLQLKKNAVQWIPVTERLPEDGRRVLVCSVVRDYDAEGNGYFMWTGAIMSDCWMVQTPYPDVLRQNENTEVIAWMPLPEPYQEE